MSTPEGSPPKRKLAGTLARIVAGRRRRIAPEARTPESMAPLEGTPAELQRSDENNSFLSKLNEVKSHRPAIIAEVKMGSPRIGSLMHRLNPLDQARLYGNHGAAALSVVVEPDFFYGSYELLERCRRISGLPVIAKDFVVNPVQLYWAREAGADAVLLIAALYEAEELLDLAQRTRSLGMVPLIETHDQEDLAMLTGQPWELVGVNNRNLRTFEVDLANSETLAPQLPTGALRVAESGISSAAEIERLSRAGFDAFLIGEALLLADNPGAQLSQFLDAQVTPRGD
ncbi:MAG: indole-3-glycerol phosphate synthase TrpC [Deltaproteobacteria bacterium]|nr:indole-3-glycerol phosphate synthase TrpC [Deltaproteobacteria bacterium]